MILISVTKYNTARVFNNSSELRQRAYDGHFWSIRMNEVANKQHKQFSKMTCWFRSWKRRAFSLYITISCLAQINSDSKFTVSYLAAVLSKRWKQSHLAGALWIPKSPLWQRLVSLESACTRRQANMTGRQQRLSAVIQKVSPWEKGRNTLTAQCGKLTPSPCSGMRTAWMHAGLLSLVGAAFAQM